MFVVHRQVDDCFQFYVVLIYMSLREILFFGFIFKETICFSFDG